MRTQETKKRGGFFSKFFSPCRPQRPEETGVAVSNSSSRQGEAAASAEKKKKSVNAIKGSSQKKKSKNAATKSGANAARDIPLIPNPPSDEATPITSNRKSLDQQQGDKKHSTTSSSMTASTRLEQVVSAKSPSSNFIDELEASVKEAATSGNNNRGAKPYPSFQNNYPVHEKVKAKHDWFEKAFASPPDVADSTESTEECTENSTGETDDFRILRPVPSGDEPIVDCGNDEWEHAYAVWYHMGLLKWRPKSVVAENEAAPVNVASSSLAAAKVEFIEEPEDVIATEGSIDLEIVERKESLAVEKAEPVESVAKEAVDDAVLLMKYRSKPATACANCGKDTSFTIELVRCLQCKQDLYCSVFCRGNDRYNHAVSCSALAGGPNDRSITNVAKVSSVFTTEPDEEKKEDVKDSTATATEIDQSGDGFSKSSEYAAPAGAVMKHDDGKTDPKDVVLPFGAFGDPSQENVSLADPLGQLKMNAGTPHRPLSPNVALYTDVIQTSSSRSSSLRKSKQAPMVSLFGADAVKGAIASPRRLAAEYS